MTQTPENKGKLPISTLVVLILALILVFIGYNNGEHRSYFQKAVLVCTQCIGLG